MTSVFENKIAVVTGAGGTLCSEIAVQLSSWGSKVFLVGRTVEKLEATAKKIEEKGGAPTIIFPCDVTDREAVKKLAEAVDYLSDAEREIHPHFDLHLFECRIKTILK